MSILLIFVMMYHTITNRPDLINETKLAVKAATLKIHQSDYYYRDLIEQGIAFLPQTIFSSSIFIVCFLTTELLSTLDGTITAVLELLKSSLKF